MAQQTRPRITSTLSLPSDLEIRVERAFAAPINKVWRAWTDPKLLPQWMGPAQYAMITSEMDLRAGGSYRWVWDLGEGNDLVITGRIFAVDAPSRMVTAERMEPYPGETHNLLVFTEKDGQTNTTVHIVFPNKEARDGALASGMQHGMDEGYARLDDLLHDL